MATPMVRHYPERDADYCRRAPMLFADGSDPPPQLPLWVSVILALGGLTGLGTLAALVVKQVLRTRRYFFGEQQKVHQQTVRERSAQQRAERKAAIEDEDRAIALLRAMYDEERRKVQESDRLHRDEVGKMESAHREEVAELRREIGEVREEHTDCRVRLARVEEALRSRGWSIPDDPNKPAVAPEHREDLPGDMGKTDPRK